MDDAAAKVEMYKLADGGIFETAESDGFAFLTDSKLDMVGVSVEQAGRVAKAIGGRRGRRADPIDHGLMPGRVAAVAPGFTEGFYVPRTWDDAWT